MRSVHVALFAFAVVSLFCFGMCGKNKDDKPNNGIDSSGYYTKIILSGSQPYYMGDSIPAEVYLYTRKKVYVFKNYGYTIDTPLTITYKGGVLLADNQSHILREPGQSYFAASEKDVFEFQFNGTNTTWKPAQNAEIVVSHSDMSVCMCLVSDEQVRRIGNNFVRLLSSEPYKKVLEMDLP